jgi:hypothetical protein
VASAKGSQSVARKKTDASNLNRAFNRITVFLLTARHDLETAISQRLCHPETAGQRGLVLFIVQTFSEKYGIAHSLFQFPKMIHWIRWET